jgi:hypothetical protein
VSLISIRDMTLEVRAQLLQHDASRVQFEFVNVLPIISTEKVRPVIFFPRMWVENREYVNLFLGAFISAVIYLQFITGRRSGTQDGRRARLTEDRIHK